MTPRPQPSVSEQGRRAQLMTAVTEAARELARIIRAYPSTLIWPLSLLALLLGLGVWGALRMADLEERNAKERATNLALDTALWFRSQILGSAIPVQILVALVSYNPQYEAVQRMFRSLGPVMLAQTPGNSTINVELVPNGVIRDTYPIEGLEKAVGLDLFASTVTGDRDGAVKAVHDRQMTLVGPMHFIQGGRGLIIRTPVFIPGVDANETFGLPDPLNPYCGEPCSYNATTRTQFWGFVAALVNIDMIGQAADSRFRTLEKLGYCYEVKALGIALPDMRLIAASSVAPKDPVEAIIGLPNNEWVVSVSPMDGWKPSYYVGVLVAMAALAIAVAALLFAVLLSRRRHQILLEALLPEKVIRDLHNNCAASLSSRQQEPDTPADMLLSMMGELLEGRMPGLRDVVFIRTALMRNWDVYQPVNLKGHIRGANLEADVAQSLMQQLIGGTADSRYGDASIARSRRSSITCRDLHTTAGVMDLILSPEVAMKGVDTCPPTNLARAYATSDIYTALAPQLTAPSRPSSCGSSSGRIAPEVKLTRAPVARSNTCCIETEATDADEPQSICPDVCEESNLAAPSMLGVLVKEEPTPCNRSPTRAASLTGAGPSGANPSTRLLTFVRGRRGSIDMNGLVENRFVPQKRPSRLGARPQSVSVAHPTPGADIVEAVPRTPFDIQQVEVLLAQADGWYFNTWALQEATQGHALSVLGFYLIQRAGLITSFRLSPVRLARLLRHIEAGYLDNPYHNAVHAADVLQTLHVIIHASQLQVHYLDPLGLLAAYYAAIMHDYGHPGLTGDLLVATSDPLAVRYNDRSPLENHHCAASFSLMQRPDLDVLAPLSKSDRATFRKQVIELVLATDMKQHFSIISHFNTVHRLAVYTQQQNQQQTPVGSSAGGLLKSAPGGRLGNVQFELKELVVSGSDSLVALAQEGPKPVDDTERLLTLQLALKCADIGHLGEALDVHKRWLGVLEEEFFQQGDRESELGLPISPLFDRSKQGVSKSQVGFYDFVALPLVHAMSSAFPGTQPLMRCFLNNYNHWKAVSKLPDEPTAKR